MDDREKLDTLKKQLNIAIKIQKTKEIDVFKQRSNERAFLDELSTIKRENELLTDKLEGYKTKIVQTMNQISTIELCETLEKMKTKNQINTIIAHGSTFQQFYDNAASRNKEFREKDIEDEEKMRIKISQKNIQKELQIADIQLEYELFEQECRGLRKKNNAIMLKLRRSLQNAKNTRLKLEMQD